MSNKNKHLRGVVYSTDPQYKYEREEEQQGEIAPNQKQQLRVRIEKQHRGGKTVTVIDGFVGKEEDREQLGKLLKQKCGAGGSVKDGLILIQGEMKERIVKLLNELGYKAK
jgi:translation initiation factor 1